ncbi:unnamed protein product [Cuscuta epithymum]|uniref:SKP1-like protein n=1 Tax=Cuscuta epithymum TaxID=186058 RepID=A0AAV0D640_9ASTE|nr:unnamed protein product [Cuscuta epithymum]CAH9124883.1 unnamed protein product [Cuscuta epithymum]
MSSTSEKKVVILRSSDGEEFQVDESAAIQSVTIKNIIEEDCGGGVIPLPNVDAKTLAKVITYWKELAAAKDAANMKEFNEKFMAEEEQDSVVALIMAANYLDTKPLLDILCQRIADTIKDMSPEEVRAFFNIENDFTPEEEAKLRSEHAWAFE